MLPSQYESILTDYRHALTQAPLDAGTQLTYLSRVRGYLAWLDTADDVADPLTDPAARDGAVRDYRSWLKTQRRTPATINNALAGIADFYSRRGLGPPAARLEPLPRRAPVALDARQTRRYLRAAEHAPPRDRALALLPYYAGLRIGEVVALDLPDIRLSARKGELVVAAGKGPDGGRHRMLPVHPDLRDVLRRWLQARPDWPGATDTPAVFLNRRGARITDRGARDIITRLGDQADLLDPDHPFGPHVLRHTFATQLVRDGVDLVIVADLLGHARLDATRVYTTPTDADRTQALNTLITDH